MELFWKDITIAWPNVLLAWTALSLIAISPGPTATAIMGISMTKGRQASFIFTAGCMTGATTWAIVAGLGLTTWLTNYANGISLLKIVGGLYLFWMAHKSLKSALTPSSDFKLPEVSSDNKNLFAKGLALHLTNPKAILSWAAVITLSQSEGGSVPVLVFTLIGALTITFIIHFTYATIFASSFAMRAYTKARRRIETVLFAVFGYAGIRLLTD